MGYSGCEDYPAIRAGGGVQPGDAPDRYEDWEPVSCKEAVNDLKEDYRGIKREAKEGYRQTRDLVAKNYEQKMEQAKRNYLEETASLRDRFHSVREQAREEFQEALDTARQEYELTVDIAKDQYKTMRTETTKMYKHGKRDTVFHFQKHSESFTESAPTRVMMRLDDEIRKVAEKKAEVEKLVN